MGWGPVTLAKVMKNMNWVNNVLGYRDVIRWGYVGCCRLGIDCRLRFITITGQVVRGTVFCGFRIWIVNTRLFQPPTTTRITISVAVKQIVLFTMLTVPA